MIDIFPNFQWYPLAFFGARKKTNSGNSRRREFTESECDEFTEPKGRLKKQAWIQLETRQI